MSNALIEKIRKFRSSLNLKRTLGLIWAITRGWTILTAILIAAETVLFFASVYLLKLLINAVSRTDLSPADHQALVLKLVIFSAVSGIAYFIVRAFSAYVTEVHASKIALYIDGKIHTTAAALDYEYFES